MGLSGLGDLLRIHVVPDQSENNLALDRAGIPRPSFYLLRPDCHVGLAGTRLDSATIAGYLSQCIHLVPTGA